MKHIKIGGHRYKVAYVGKFESRNTIGNCLQKDAKIEILKGMPSSIEEETVIHEVLHAVCYHAGVSHDKKGMVNEEQIIEALSNGLFQLGFKPPIK